MIDLIQEVGRGKRGARDLTYEEAVQAAERIVSGEATDAQIGAFLVAERIKMESTEEILAFVHTLAAHSVRHPLPGSLDCAGPYDGRRHSFFATLPSAFVLAANGIPVTLHASSPLPPKWGVALSDVIGEWGVRLDSLERLRYAAAVSGFWFVPSALGCPPLARLERIRKELGLRTVLNTAEKLLRYSEAPYLAFGVFHGTVFEKMAALVTKLGIERALIVQGMEGSEDVPAHRRSRLYRVESGVPELIIMDPELYELHAEAEETPKTAKEQAELARLVLSGEAEYSYTNMTILNSGLRLWLTGAAGTIEEGLELARVTLASGQAHRKFIAWMEAVHTSAVSSPARP